MIEIPTLDGDDSFQAYEARPGGEPKAAIIVIQEIFGVNEGIRRKCDHWASLGYLALAPDLFWRLEPGVELDADIESEFKQALDLMGRFNQDQGIRDIEATIRAARKSLGNNGKVGCVGYYAVGVDNLLREKHAISRPLLLHIAGADHFVDAATQAKMHEGLDDHSKVTLHDYPGEDHGFAAELGKRRSEAAAKRADARTEEFLARHLA